MEVHFLSQLGAEVLCICCFLTVKIIWKVLQVSAFCCNHFHIAKWRNSRFWFLHLNLQGFRANWKTSEQYPPTFTSWSVKLLRVVTHKAFLPSSEIQACKWKQGLQSQWGSRREGWEGCRGPHHITWWWIDGTTSMGPESCVTLWVRGDGRNRGTSLVNPPMGQDRPQNQGATAWGCLEAHGWSQQVNLASPWEVSSQWKVTKAPHLLPRLNWSHKVSCHNTNRNKVWLSLQVIYWKSKAGLANAM